MGIMMYKTMPVAILAAFFVLVSCGPGGGSSGDDDGDDDYEGNWDTESPLHGVYTDTFLIGNIISPSDLDGVKFKILKHHFNTATAENHMKPDNIAPASSGGAYKWDDADKLVAAVNEAGLKMHGHTLIWHSQTPSWLTNGTEEAVANSLKKYVTDVVTHFKGKVISWDVVNEAMDETDNLKAALEGDGDGWRTYDWTLCLRNSPWNKAGKDKAGTTYIEAAFRAARAADPDAKLFYNDYNLNSQKKSRATYLMVKDINDKWKDGGNTGLLIDGIGMQTHHHLNTNPDTVKTATELFASLGVEIAVSEMDIVAAKGGDVNDSRLGAWNEEASRKQAELYAKLFKIYKENAAHITRVTFWGIDDGTSWRSVNYPTLLDKNFDLKPAFYAVQDPSKF
jgi:endo-1,4-beta-xylanase